MLVFRGGCDDASLAPFVEGTLAVETGGVVNNLEHPGILPRLWVR